MGHSGNNAALIVVAGGDFKMRTRSTVIGNITSITRFQLIGRHRRVI